MVRLSGSWRRGLNFELRPVQSHKRSAVGLRRIVRPITIMNDMDLFTLAEARAKRDEGVKQSSDHSGEEWKDEAISFVRSYLLEHPTLFVDELWDTGLSRPDSPRALGAVIQHARKEGWMAEQAVDGCILARPSKSSNMQLKRVWMSLICIVAKNQDRAFTK
jgi:hypothetical protein